MTVTCRRFEFDKHQASSGDSLTKPPWSSFAYAERELKHLKEKKCRWKSCKLQRKIKLIKQELYVLMTKTSVYAHISYSFDSKTMITWTRVRAQSIALMLYSSCNLRSQILIIYKFFWFLINGKIFISFVLRWTRSREVAASDEIWKWRFANCPTMVSVNSENGKVCRNAFWL